MSSLYGLIKRIYMSMNPPVADPLSDNKPIKFGILGAAAIAPDAILTPAKSHPEAVVYAIAARNKDKANEFAKKHGIAKVFSGPEGYQELLDDPEIDAIYNPLPNALHYEWTMKALAAGKHVLLEKPSACTAEETRRMFELADRKGLVLLEAFHYRFHPAAHRIKAIIESGELGAVKSTYTSLALHAGFMKPDDIRFDFSLGGGALMDMGCYTISSMRYFAGDPTTVLSVEHELVSPQIDRKTTATLALPGGATGAIHCDLGMPPYLKIFPRYIMPTLYHSISVTPRGGKGRVEKAYTFAKLGEPWWTTYRYQLEAFVNKVKGRTPHAWVTKEDSIKNMEVIESVYAKSGLGSRPKSDFIPALIDL